MDTAQQRAMTKAPVFFCLVLLACAEDSEPATPAESAEHLLASAALDAARAQDDEASPPEPPYASVLQACYAQLPGRESPREVHAMGRYLALGERMMVVRVTIPEAPQLARCIENAVKQSAPPGWQQAPDRLVCGSFAIDLGGAPPRAQPGDIERQYEEHERGMAALMRETLALGVLPADHPLVQELLTRAGEDD
jgi:hypothetical protein